ncbi:hypothetical protein [Chitinophaga sp. HK235]|uniref:hypothetical protein n=1 Tax=Chitinophaga sp. HK235 TaxID=2952571 RepID=UPI001BACA993|nr:hypothetical protein [Chitinophaga sp. HK235]
MKKKKLVLKKQVIHQLNPLNADQQNKVLGGFTTSFVRCTQSDPCCTTPSKAEKCPTEPPVANFFQA